MPPNDLQGAAADAPRAPAMPSAVKDKDQAELLLKAWEKAIDTQEHFNDIEMRIRNLALTILGAVIAFGKVVNRMDWLLEGYVFLALIGIAATFWFMDKHWYHRLLVGAVAEAIALETKLTALGVPISQSKVVKDKSPFDLFGRKVHSADKIDVFYLMVGTMALIAAGASFGKPLAIRFCRHRRVGVVFADTVVEAAQTNNTQFANTPARMAQMEVAHTFGEFPNTLVAAQAA
jgi:hypothetical protein